MSEPQQRPLMTFALFAYNQETFIREAVEGAFAQTYEPLEIILSDDCSTDRTFEIMQEMALAYRGNHDVVLNRAPRNKGLLSHIIDTCKQARGEIIVVAAGDDISYPQRVHTLVQEFEGDSSTYCVSSGFDLMDENGAVIFGNHVTPVVRMKTFLHPGRGESYTAIQGSTAGYRREFFSLGFPEVLLPCAEDQLFTFIAYVNRKRVKWIPIPLILYRQHQNALANFNRIRMSAREVEVAVNRARVMTENLLVAMETVAERCLAPELVNKTEIEQELRGVRICLRWGQLPTRKRLVQILRAMRVHQSSLMMWQLVRLWGRFPDYIPIKYLHPLPYLLRDKLR